MEDGINTVFNCQHDELVASEIWRVGLRYIKWNRGHLCLLVLESVSLLGLELNRLALGLGIEGNGFGLESSTSCKSLFKSTF